MLDSFRLVEDRAGMLSLFLLAMLLAWESVHPYWFFYRHHARKRLLHAVRNLVLGLLNAFMVAMLFVTAWLWAAETAAAHDFGVVNWLNLDGTWRAVTAILLLDLWTYWWHRINHEWKFLWRFHRVHHSDPSMDVTTANRFHFGEIFLSSVLRVPVIFLTGAELWHLALYEAVMFPVVQFHHANIWVGGRLDRFLRVIIVTPAMHKVHHSRLQPETDSNYTSLLSVWDRLFGTFRLRADPHEISTGLDGYDDDAHQRLSGLMRTPVENNTKA